MFCLFKSVNQIYLDSFQCYSADSYINLFLLITSGETKIKDWVCFPHLFTEYSQGFCKFVSC